jgi:pimeloyl-ACP methyl ester carboxylesterase
MRRAARGFLRPSGRRTPRTPQSLGLDGDAFAIPTAAGALRGWVLRASSAPRPLVIVAHGWNSNAGDMLPWAEPIVRAGYHALVFDALGHGESDAADFTSLRHFREDLATVIDWGGARPEADGLVLFGHSMGGAAAILVASAGAPVRGVIVAGAPTDPLTITREWMDAKGLPGALAVALMRPFWAGVISAPYETLRPIISIATLTVPVLILHGVRDRHVPLHHGERLAAANPGARLVRFESGDHYNLPTLPAYRAELLDFLAAATGTAATVR